MTKIHPLADADSVTLRPARAKPQARAVLEADGAIDRIGDHRVHGNVHGVDEAQLARPS